MTPARRARRGWWRSNGIALGSLVLLVPLLGWSVTSQDYDAWRKTEPRDPITVTNETVYADATWYPATVEVEPRPVNGGPGTELPPKTTRIRVHLALEVDDLKLLELETPTPGKVTEPRGVAGCRVWLRAPDGRMWAEDTGDFGYADRPGGCSGGTDTVPPSFLPKDVAKFYLKPKAGQRFETAAVFVVPREVANSVEAVVTWEGRLPQYLRFPRR